jgi:zinc transporter ZupT
MEAFFRKHADVLAGLLAWYIVGQIVGPRVGEWGIVTLVLSIGAGVVAYLAVQKFFPESRG